MTLNINDKQVIDQIFQKGVLIDLDISWWAGQQKLRPEDLGIPSEDINEDLFSLGRKRFIPKSWIGKFRKWEQKGRTFVANYSFQFKKQAGTYFVPLTAIETVVEKLEEFKGEFNSAVNELEENYEGIKERMIASYELEAENIYKRLKIFTRKFPTFEDFKNTFMAKVRSFYPARPSDFFKYEWTFYEMVMPREAEMKKTNLKDKLTKIQQDEEKNRALVRKYTNSFDSQIHEFIGSIVKQLRGATSELVEKVSTQVKEGKVTDNRIDRLRDFISRFRKINFINDVEVERELDGLNKLIEKNNAEDFNTNADLETRLKSALGSVLEVVAKDGSKVIEKAFGFKRRVIKRGGKK